MDKCLSCGLLIGSDDYNYCPCCGQVIRSFDVTCPERAYLKVPFSISIHSSGSHSLKLDKLFLNEILLAEGVSLKPGISYDHELVIAEEGISNLRVQSGSLEESYQINVVERGMIALHWQNNQLISELDKASHKVYVSRNLDDKSIYLSESSLWFRAKRIRLKGQDFSFELDQIGNLFRISDDLFDYLQDKDSASLDLEMVSEENHRIELPGIYFYYDSDLPNLKLIAAEDYVNSNPLCGTRDNIGFSLEYKWDQTDLERPINAITIELSGNGIAHSKSLEYFNDLQRLEKRFKVDTSIITSGLGRICAVLSYEIHERKFRQSHWIDYQVKNIGDVSIDPSRVVAIDFGTSNTCLAYVDQRSQKEELYQYHIGIKNTPGFNPTFMKFIQFNDSGNHEIEYSRPRDDRDLPLTFAANFKPRLERDEELFFWDLNVPPKIKPLKPSQLSRMYLNATLNRFAVDKGFLPGTILMSYPASFSHEAKSRLFKAINIPGVIIQAEGTLSEPENIALYYALHNESIKNKLVNAKKLTVCVFDCGGGTTDVSIVKISESDTLLFEILATWGTDSFSGNVIDYFVGKDLDNEPDWYPKDVSDLYTSSNESLRKYLSRSLYYEDVKKETFFNLEGHYDKDRTEVSVMIIDMYNRVINLMKSLYDLRKLDTFETDFLILAGNSCALKIFFEIALETFTETTIIYEPGEGKKAVALGALEAYKLSAVLDIRGTSLSSKEYFVRLNLHGYESIFQPLLDMKSVTDYLSPPVNPIQIPILGRTFIRDHDHAPTILFEVPTPKTRIGTAKMRFRLRFKDKEISYCWCSIDGEEIADADYKFIYRED